MCEIVVARNGQEVIEKWCYILLGFKYKVTFCDFFLSTGIWSWFTQTVTLSHRKVFSSYFQTPEAQDSQGYSSERILYVTET